MKYHSSLEWHSTPNETNAKPSTIAILCKAGLCPGFPDLTIQWTDNEDIQQYRYLELKTKKGRMSKNQTAWHAKHRGRNVQTAVAYGYDDAIEIVTNWFEAAQ